MLQFANSIVTLYQALMLRIHQHITIVSSIGIQLGQARENTL